MTDPLRHSLAYGALAFGAGGMFGLFLFSSAIGEGYCFLPVAGSGSAFVAGAFFWRLLLEKRGRLTYPRALMAGCLTVGVTHFATLYSAIVGYYLCYIFTGGCKDSLGGPPMNPVTGFPDVLLLAALSLIGVGWISLPLGAGLSGVFLFFRKRRGGSVSVQQEADSQ